MTADLTDTLLKVGIGSIGTVLAALAYDFFTSGKKYVTKTACQEKHGGCQTVADLKEDFRIYKAENDLKMTQVTTELADMHSTVKASNKELAQLSKNTTIITTYMQAKGLIPNDLETT